MRELAWFACGTLAVAVIAATGLWLLYRAARRRWRRFVAAGVGAASTHGLALGLRWCSAQPFTSSSWWRLQRDRQRMWRAVSTASKSVETAQAAGAPIGDLPRLCKDLRRTAEHLDAFLVAQAAPTSAPGHQRASRQLAASQKDLPSVLAAAADIHHSAVLALADEASPRVRALSSSVRIETEAFRSGLASARRGRAESLV